MLTVTAQNLGDALVLQCHGRIVRGEETAILCSAARQDGRNVILDLTDVETIDAAGVGALVSLQAAGIYLKIINPTEQVRETLRITKLDSIFEISTLQVTNESLVASTSDSPEPAYQATVS